MTFGKDVRKSKYPLAAMEVGAVYAHRAESKEEQKRIRRAAHNRNVRSDMYFITRCKDGVVFITRIR
jgi:hypothetical protein